MSGGPITVRGLEPLERLRRNLDRILVRAMDQALEIGLAQARSRMGNGGPAVRTGRLLRSLGKRVEVRGDQVIGELYADAPYAALQEHGGVIQAKRRDYLRFRVGERWAMVKRVTIPPRPYLRPGADAAAEALPGLVAEAIRKELSAP